MEHFLLVLSIIMVIIGLLGSVLPVLPGPPLAFIGLLLLKLTDQYAPSNNLLLIYFVVGLIITLLDYYIPILGTKLMGGSKKGKIGSMIGLVVGLFVGPLGLIFGPFVGALVGELWNKTPRFKAFKSAIGSLIGFVTATLMKLGYSVFIIVEMVKLVF